MRSNHAPIQLAKDQPILRRARQASRKSRQIDVERLQRDFWKHFDLEKFATDWRRGIGKRPAAA